MTIGEPFSGNLPFTRVVHGLRRADIATVQRGLSRFDSEEPPTIQRTWEVHVPRDPAYDEPDDGVIRKVGRDGQDRKLFLHYRHNLSGLLTSKGIRLKLWQCTWLAACSRIWTACATATDELAREMDEARPDFRFAERVAEYRDQHVLRVVRYDPRPNGLANEHSDRSAVTFRIVESHAGFYAKDGWGRIYLPTPATPEVDCFAGDQLEHITKGGIRRVWHGADDTTGGTATRFAVVFFGKMYPK
ncbi:MAG: 2OG-Fe(II) oxygenase family protein [bacterium]|nr:2OG-Fe(II) oxygenase family protein [bacterium]